MKVLFVEMPWFSKRLKSRLQDTEYRELQQALLADPTLGNVMPGCGGLRKLRWGQSMRGTGSRGGVRIIYFWIPEAMRVDMFDIYGKDEKEDLSAAEKRVLAAMVKEVRREAIAAFQRSGGTHERA